MVDHLHAVISVRVLSQFHTCFLVHSVIGNLPRGALAEVLVLLRGSRTLTRLAVDAGGRLIESVLPNGVAVRSELVCQFLSLLFGLLAGRRVEFLKHLLPQVSSVIPN